MKKIKLIEYWNKFYDKKIINKESTFAKFTYKKIKKQKGKILDIGCGNGRDSFFFNQKGYNVTGIDISKKAIQKNSKKNRKFEIIYCRFFLHTVDHLLEKKLIHLIKKTQKKNTLVFFEFRNFKDKIFGKFRASDHNKVIEFEKGHFRRIINPKIFKRTFIEKTKAKIIYEKSGINLSIFKNDNPNLSRIIFKF